MNVEIFTLCDAATTDSAGKLNILGSFDRISSRSSPIVHANCAIAAKLRFERIEDGKKQIRVSIIDTDGNSVVPDIGLQAEIQVPPGESNATFQLVVLIPKISLPNFGEYSINLAVDGRSESSIPLFARQI